MMASTPAIGIDFGTTYARVAVFQNGKVEVIPNDHGQPATPTYITFKDTGSSGGCFLVGDVAKEESSENPVNAAFNIGRLIGHRYEINSTYPENLTFTVVNENQEEVKKFVPEQVSAMILAKMKGTAEAYLGKAVTDAVLTVPAYFNSWQREATKKSATIAGLNVIRLISAPAASAISYEFDEKPKPIEGAERNIMIFDLGGGTLDLAIICMDGGVLEMRSTYGDIHLGGVDFDNRMVSYLAQKFRDRYGPDICTCESALCKLLKACENAKIVLSCEEKAPIKIDSLYDGIDFSTSITRAKFEELNADLFRKILEAVEKVYEYAREPTIHDVVLVGGSSRIPKIERLLRGFFDRRGGFSRMLYADDDDAVVCGAAIYAAIIQGVKSRRRKLSDTLLLDITPLSLGIEKLDADGNVTTSPIIPRHTTIPTKQIRTCTTHTDNQSDVLIKFYEGYNLNESQQVLLKKIAITGIPPASRGVPQIQVAADIDCNGILGITVKSSVCPAPAEVRKSPLCSIAEHEEDGTDMSDVEMLNFADIENGININITNHCSRLSKEEVERMAMDAKVYKENEKKFKDLKAAKINLENYCSHVKTLVENNQNNISDNDRKTVLDHINDDGVLSLLNSNTQVEEHAIEDKLKELKRICNPILTKRSHADANGSAGPSNKRKRID